MALDPVTRIHSPRELFERKRSYVPFYFGPTADQRINNDLRCVTTMNMHKRTYSNPWASYAKPSIWRVLNKALLTSVPSDTNLPPAPEPVIPDFRKEPAESRVMWLGHASVYVQLPTSDGTFGILFDPIFSSRKLFGPKRRMNAPCRVDELPAVHLVVISHDHYDHLDEATLVDIEHSHPHVQYLVPLGVKALLQKSGIGPTRITELGWWDSHSLHPLTHKGSTSGSPKIDLEIPGGSLQSEDTLPSPTSTTFTDTTLNEETAIVATCCPAQHNSGRGLWNRNRTLWATWFLNCRMHTGDRFRIFFGGDTGFRSSADGPVCPIFREIATSLGPPDLALLPISAGACLPFIENLLHLRLNITALTRHLHCPPEDAVHVHRDLQARQSLGIHWGTFTTSLGARRSKAEFERVTVGGFDLLDPGVWLDISVSNHS